MAGGFLVGDDGGIPSQPVLVVDTLVRRYGDLIAVEGVSFQIDAGETYGLSDPTAPARRRRSPSSQA